MFPFIKRQSASGIIQKPLLDDNELLSLRQIAEQIDCSASLKIRLESRQSGNLPSRALGSGIDYAESRVYQSGDDTRSINWRLSARSHETFVKTFHIESRPSINVFLDRRRSMVFGTRKRLKIAQAVRVAYLLGYASDYHQLGFQAWIIDNNRIQYFDNTDAFLVQANKPCSMTRMNLNLDMSQVLQDIIELSVTSSLVYLLSDFNDFEKTHQAELARLNEQCLVQAIHFTDKAEFELPAVGKIRLQIMPRAIPGTMSQAVIKDREDRNYQLDTYKQKEREVFSLLSREYFDNKKSIFNDLGIVYKQLETDVEKLQKYIDLPLGLA